MHLKAQPELGWMVSSFDIIALRQLALELALNATARKTYHIATLGQHALPISLMHIPRRLSSVLS